MTDDPFYKPLYVWEARGDIAPTDHTDWGLVEAYQPTHLASKDHRARGRGLTYQLRAVRPEDTWGHLDEYRPRHRAAA